MMDFDDIFERILQGFLIIFLGVGLVMVIGATIYLFKRDIIGPDEHTKLLEQSLNEQIQEKEVYMKMLESEEK
jgi:hypothetical protein